MRLVIIFVVKSVNKRQRIKWSVVVAVVQITDNLIWLITGVEGVNTIWVPVISLEVAAQSCI